MVLSVEDGTGLPDADAYVSLAAADLYAAARSWTDWDAASDAAKEAAIREATLYLDTSYNWKGSILDEDQALAWPREGLTDREGREVSGLPQRVIDACCELARSQITASLVTARTEGEIASLTAGSVSVTYVRGNRVREAERFTWVDRLLMGLHSGRAGGINFAISKS